MPRSLSVHPDHKSAIALTLERNGFLTQGDLAANLEIALSTVNNFFRGIKVSVSKFEQICEALDLEPREIILPSALQGTSESPTATSNPGTERSRSAYFSYDPFWVGREALTQTLLTKLQANCRLLLLTGLSGIGKTALSERIASEYLAQQQGKAPYQLIRENLDGEEISQSFSSVAARLLESCGQTVSPEDRSDTQQLMRRLIVCLQRSPYLVLIDSLENLLHSSDRTEWSEFKDANFATFFQNILAANEFQSRFILTSQERPAQIVAAGSRYPNFYHAQPISGLSEAEQTALFEKTGFVSGSDTPPAELIRIGNAYEGHPLALRTILGEISDRPFFGNVRAYWQRYGQEIEEVERAIAAAAVGQTAGADDKWQLERFTRALQLKVQQRLERTFARLRQDAKYAYVLLCEASVYRCAVPADWWLSHLEDWEQDEKMQVIALDALRDRYLVEEKIEEKTEDTELLLKQHNLIRSVALAHLEKLTFDL